MTTEDDQFVYSSKVKSDVFGVMMLPYEQNQGERKPDRSAMAHISGRVV